MNNTFFVTIQSLLLIFIIHFLIKNNLENEAVFSQQNEKEVLDNDADNSDLDDNDDDDNLEVEQNMNQIPNKNQINSTLENFNAESLKEDLENYLDNKIVPNSNMKEYEKSQFTDSKFGEKTPDYYSSINKNIENTYLSKPVSEEDTTGSARIDYEEWVYNDENKMNGSELSDGIHPYDDMENNFAYIDG